MRRAAVLWLPFIASLNLSAGSQDRAITFAGEVSQGEAFWKSIGHGLDFVLTPSSAERGAISGWTMEVSPQGRPADPQCTDFVWVVTPPYRFQNARYLDTSYGTTAQDAVRASPREFNFVLSCADFKTERERLDRVLSPYMYSKKDVDEALAKLGSSPVGKGRLWIEDYRIAPGQKSAAGVDLGVIRWIGFKVEIKFPD